MNLLIGCCGFPVKKNLYFKHFNLVELQTTFYQLPGEETVILWQSQAPEQFVFCMKAWQGVTHPIQSPTYRRWRKKASFRGQPENLGLFQPTKEVREAWQNTLRIARLLRCTVVLLQCPPAFVESRENHQRIYDFFSLMPRDGLQLAIEFRAPWRRETIDRLCADLHLIHCTDPFKEIPSPSSTSYLRLHGAPPGDKMYNYRYTDEDLIFLKRIISKIESEYIYCLFNNISMFEDAQRFKILLES